MYPSGCNQQKRPLFPYTTLFRSIDARGLRGSGADSYLPITLGYLGECYFQGREADKALGPLGQALELCRQDRKSTRLNSSHLGISYAVFCLKQKKQE